MRASYRATSNPSRVFQLGCIRDCGNRDCAHCLRARNTARVEGTEIMSLHHPKCFIFAFLPRISIRASLHTPIFLACARPKSVRARITARERERERATIHHRAVSYKADWRRRWPGYEIGIFFCSYEKQKEEKPRYGKRANTAKVVWRARKTRFRETPSSESSRQCSNGTDAAAQLPNERMKV